MKFKELIHELECDYGRINSRERLMLRRAYDVMPEKDEQDKKNFTYEDYQKASNDITYSQYPFWRG